MLWDLCHWGVFGEATFMVSSKVGMLSIQVGLRIRDQGSGLEVCGLDFGRGFWDWG